MHVWPSILLHEWYTAELYSVVGALGDGSWWSLCSELGLV